MTVRPDQPDVFYVVEAARVRPREIVYLPVTVSRVTARRVVVRTVGTKGGRAIVVSPFALTVLERTKDRP